MGQIYSEIHDWIDSKKATEDIEGLLQEVKSEVSQLEQEMKLIESDYSFNSLYKDNKFKRAFDWGNISRWSKRYDRVDYEYSHKDLERIDLTSIMRIFSGNSLPIELAILFRKLNQLRFVWDIKEKKIVMAEWGDTLPETVTEVYLDKDGSHKIVLSSGKKILADQVRDFRKDKNNQEVSLTSKVVSRKDKFNGEDFEERFIFIHDRVQDEKDFSLAKEHETKTGDTVVD